MGEGSTCFFVAAFFGDAFGVLTRGDAVTAFFGDFFGDALLAVTTVKSVADSSAADLRFLLLAEGVLTFGILLATLGGALLLCSSSIFFLLNHFLVPPTINNNNEHFIPSNLQTSFVFENTI